MHQVSLFVIDDFGLSDANDNDDVKMLKVYNTCSKRSIRLAASKDVTKKKKNMVSICGRLLKSFLLFAQVYTEILQSNLPQSG